MKTLIDTDELLTRCEGAMAGSASYGRKNGHTAAAVHLLGGLQNILGEIDPRIRELFNGKEERPA